MNPKNLFAIALSSALSVYALPAQAETEEYLQEIVIKAPENVYSGECMEHLRLSGQNSGCDWGGQCNIALAYAVPVDVEEGWFKVQVTAGGWATYATCCGDCAAPEHTYVNVVVPSTEARYGIGSNDNLSFGEAKYFPTNAAETIYFVFEDIDNKNNGGSVTVTLWRSYADDDYDGHQDMHFGGDDCDDDNPQIYPDASELCDGQDNNCDTTIDEGTDYDGEGSSDCADNDSDGFTEIGGDCDDQDSGVYPCAQELYDQIDNDCDGLIDNPGNAVGCSCGDGKGTEGCAMVLLLSSLSWLQFRWRRRRGAGAGSSSDRLEPEATR